MPMHDTDRLDICPKPNHGCGNGRHFEVNKNASLVMADGCDHTCVRPWMEHRCRREPLSCGSALDMEHGAVGERRGGGTVFDWLREGTIPRKSRARASRSAETPRSNTVESVVVA